MLAESRRNDHHALVVSGAQPVDRGLGIGLSREAKEIAALGHRDEPVRHLHRRGAPILHHDRDRQAVKVPAHGFPEDDQIDDGHEHHGDEKGAVPAEAPEVALGDRKGPAEAEAGHSCLAQRIRDGMA